MLGKDLLGLCDASAEDIMLILDTAVNMKKLLTQNLKKLPHLQGRTVTTLFYENSTRTRVSFELAAKYLGAGTVNVSASSSSVQKGETLIDTGKTLDAMKNDVIVIRHPMGGAPHLLAKNVRASVINAGDGMNEHPTQALLDLFTMREKFGSVIHDNFDVFDFALTDAEMQEITALNKKSSRIFRTVEKSRNQNGVLLSPKARIMLDNKL